jgi:Flp pilus assembly protein TadD
LGEVYARLSQAEGALTSYQSAIAAFDRALSLAPDDISAHNSRGIALQSLGDLQASLS